MKEGGKVIGYQNMKFLHYIFFFMSNKYKFYRVTNWTDSLQTQLQYSVTTVLKVAVHWRARLLNKICYISVCLLIYIEIYIMLLLYCGQLLYVIYSSLFFCASDSIRS